MKANCHFRSTRSTTEGSSKQPKIRIVNDALIFVLIAAIGIIIAIASYVAAARRRQALEEMALANGWTFHRSSDYTLDRRYPFFPCLRNGDNRYAYHKMTGSYNGYEFIGFDYHYQTYSHSRHGRQTHHHHFSAVILRSRIPLKYLYIRPENFLDRITEFVGIDDIDFESAEFSRRFYVKANDRRWAYDVIHQRTMEFLLSQPVFSIQFGPTDVIAWRGKLFQPADFPAAAEVISGILERLPDYLVKQQMETLKTGGDPGYG
jgi:hypothetical protein